MLLWTTLGLAVVGWLLYLIGGKIRNWHIQNTLENVGGGMSVIFTIILVFMLAWMATEYIGVDAQAAKKQTHRDFLVTQYKTGIYDSSVYSQYNLLQKIDEWNCELAKMQKLTHDYWVGIFYTDRWDSFDYITVNLFEDVTTGRE